MKRVCVLLSLLAFAPLVRAQDSPAAWRDELTENYEILKGQIAEQKEVIDLQRKTIDKLQGDISDLRKQLAKPPGNFASADDVKTLRDAIQDEARKRQADDEKILTEVTKQISKIAKVADGAGSGMGAISGPGHRPPQGGAVVGPPVKLDHGDGDGGPTPPSTPDGPYLKYEVKENDNPGKIARKLFEEKGIKISGQAILAANPSIKDPTKMYVGQQIIIPLPKTDGDGRH